MRTANSGGFQLLGLSDFPGQGSAFVGILDAFGDSKGLVTPENTENRALRLCCWLVSRNVHI